MNKRLNSYTISLLLLASACGGGSSSNPPDGGDAGDGRPVAILGNPLHVSAAGAGIDGGVDADGTELHPFASLYDAIAQVAAHPEWKGEMVVHSGRYDLPTEITLPTSADLQVLPGVRFYLGSAVSIHAQRDMNIHGEEGNPVLFTWLNENSAWGALTNAEPTSQNNVVTYAVFEHGGESQFAGVPMHGAMSLASAGGIVSNNEFRFNEGADALEMRASNALVEYNNFHDNLQSAFRTDTAGTGDAVVELRFNHFEHNALDAVSVGEGSSALVHHNVVLGAGGGGISSVGETASPRIENNLIVGCHVGIALKGGANPTITNNSVYGNNFGIVVDQTAVGPGLGSGTFSNGVIWNSAVADVLMLNPSVERAPTTFRYSCLKSGAYLVGSCVEAGDGCVPSSTSEYPLEGDGLLSAAAGCPDPLFAAPGHIPVPAPLVGTSLDPGDFHLMSTAGRFDPVTKSFTTTDTMTSPLIDMGDPDMPVGLEPAPNGGRINIGSYGGTAEASKSPL